MSLAMRPRKPVLASLSAALLAAFFSASACIPPELAAGAGTGAGTSVGGATGGLATGGIGVSGGMSGGAGGSTLVLCETDACNAAGGHCESGACLFDCSSPGACVERVKCPMAMPCRVQCDGTTSCESGVDGAHAGSLEVLCNGAEACGNAGPTANIDCPDSGGTCQIWCEANACAHTKVTSVTASAAVVCEGEGSCVDLRCNGQCTLTCGAMSACGKITCDTGPCDVACSSTGTCANVVCATGRCAIDCQGSGACATVDCGVACACDVTCGTLACKSADPVCPGDTDMNGPCAIAKGCDSALPNCDTCP